MANWARIERDRLCDTLEEVGPDAPTLCGDWTARDLAAHLVVRERRPDAALGIVVRVAPVAAHGERVRRAVAGRDWTALVRAVRNGPPRWSPTRLAALDAAANNVEFFVHHEDVRRAQPDWAPRELDAGHDEALTRALRRLGPLLRRSPVGVDLALAGGEVVLHRSGPDPVTVTGPAGELLLFAFGRQAHARVTLEGSDASRTALLGATLGI